ncbi:hypothetical protein EON83_22585 [bacterium]|nr:MAG: hypothetical protein EON83_22585 [bacterium]
MPLFSSRPRILDVDGSLRRQKGFLEESGASIESLASWGPRLRYLCRRQVRQGFERHLSTEDAHRLTYYGSGDFHHLTFSLLKFQREPLSAVVFDQHPDWDVTSPFPCCGSWVNDALSLPHVKRIVVIGAGSEDLGGVQLWRGNRAALSSGRLEIYPASLASSLWPGIGRKLECGVRKSGRMRWKTVEQAGLKNLMQGIIARLPSRRVYISVDKDCFMPSYATSNWDAGELRLDEVCLGIRMLREQCELMGADVTGEWSKPRFKNPLFAAISRSDHPIKPIPSSEELRRNEETNRVLWRAFGGG